MFRDEATLHLKAGKGGDGCISFHRAKYVPRGGPDGGNGGHGGSVVLRAVGNLNSLDRIARRPLYTAKDGQPGRSQNCHGANADDLIIDVPCGTLVKTKKGELLADLTEADSRYVVCEGGKGGKGNVHFATATRQVPRIATRGTPGAEGKFTLELKLIAQVGLIGLPNAGKSTFLRSTTRAKPAVASYPFTTLTPKLGVARLGESRELVIADIPGLIEGASDGVGLGDEFLKHVERTQLFLHLVDVTGDPALGSEEPLKAWQTIRKELLSYRSDFANKQTVIALNKCDAVTDEQAEDIAKALRQASGSEVFCISAVSGQGTKPLLFRLAALLDEAEAEAASEAAES